MHHSTEWARLRSADDPDRLEFPSTTKKPRRSCAFGSLAGVLAFAPPDHSGTLPQPHITDEDRARVLGILDDLGYVLVPDEAWHLPYDGQNAAAREEAVSWADRFLGYVSPQ